MNQKRVAVSVNRSRWWWGGVAATDLTKTFISVARKTVRLLLMIGSV
jgi:hypothetical protein